MSELLSAHVDALARAVHGPSRARQSMLREVRGGLEDAADAYLRGGLDADRAAALAVRDFGPVSELAPIYQEELAAGAGRRTAVLVAVGMPALLLGWNLLWASGLAPGPPAPPVVAALATVQDIAAVLAGVVALVLAVLGSRSTGSPRRIAAAAAATALGVVAVCGGAAVVMNLAQAGQTWVRLTAQPASLLVYLASAAMVALLCRSAARTLCALRAPTGYDQGGRSAVQV